MTKDELVQAMRDEGVVRVTLRYSGSGDEGFLYDVEYELQDGATVLAQDGPSHLGLRDEWDELHNRVLEACDYDGYWNNEGGGGQIELDVATGKITIQHYWIVMQEEEDSPREVTL